jgi:hypothetical protein
VAKSGRAGASAWLDARAIAAPRTTRWHAELAMDVIDGPAPVEFDERVDTRFHIDIYSEEWGFFFCHDGRASWIRVTDIPFVHGRDDYHLLGVAPNLDDIGALVRTLERLHQVKFRREHATIRTNLASGEASIRSWLVAL